MKITILGCGSATGTPAVGLGWGDLDPNNIKNQRLRSSILVEKGETCILIDTTPDLRQQLLNAGVNRLDAVLYTHFHADHLNGIDDLRQINRVMNSSIKMYADQRTMDEIKERFGYVIEPLAVGASFYYKPTLDPHILDDNSNLKIGDIEIDIFSQDHGFSNTLGFRFGPIAYSTDVVELSEKAFEVLSGVDTWIIGVLNYKPHPTHAHIDKALGWIERINPKRCVFTHMGLNLDYETLKMSLPKNVEPGFDGMIIKV